MNPYLKYFSHVTIVLLLSLLSACSTLKAIKDIRDLEVPEIATVVADENVLRFIVMGDTGTGKPGQYDVAKAVSNHCASKACDFILLLGDNMYQSGVENTDDAQFQTKFEIPYKDIKLPFHAVLGNHDYGSAGAGLELRKALYQIAYTNKSSKWKMPHLYYRYTLNQTLFVGLDTQAQFLGVDKNQQRKVSGWINGSNATWKIAYGHHPYMSNGPHGNAGNYDGVGKINIVNGKNIKEFADNVWCGKIDLYLSGHDHSRQWLKPTCGGTQLMVSGAGAKVTTLPGNNETYFQADTIGFIYIVIEADTLRADFIDSNGIVEFSRSITKP